MLEITFTRSYTYNWYNQIDVDSTLHLFAIIIITFLKDKLSIANTSTINYFPHITNLTITKHIKQKRGHLLLSLTSTCLRPRETCASGSSSRASFATTRYKPFSSLSLFSFKELITKSEANQWRIGKRWKHALFHNARSKSVNELWFAFTRVSQNK